MRLLVLVTLAAFASRSDGQGFFGFDPLKGLNNAIKNPLGAFKNASDNFNRAIKDPVGSIQDFVNKTTTATNNFTKEINQKVRDGLSDPVGAFRNATEDLGKVFGGSAANNATNDVGSKIQDAIKNPFGALSNLTKEIDRGIKNSVNKTLSTVNNITTTIGKGLSDAANDPLGALSNLTENANKTIRTLTNVTQNAGKGLRNLITDPVGSLSNLTKGLTDTIGSVVNNTLQQADNLVGGLDNNSGLDLFDAAFALLDDAVQNDSVFGVLGTAALAIFQAIRPVFSGKSATQALERISKIEDRAGRVLPYFVSVLLMGPINSIKMPLNLVSLVQSLFGSS